MKRPWFARPLNLATAAFGRDGKPNYRFILGLALFGVLQILAVLLASWHDKSLILPPPGRGLLQHYGAGAILVSDTIFLVAAGFAFSRFKLAMRDAPLLGGDGVRRRWETLVNRSTGWVEARGY